MTAHPIALGIAPRPGAANHVGVPAVHRAGNEARPGEDLMDKDKVKAFADKVFGDMAGAMTAGMGYVGVKTGLFRAMAGKGPMRVEDVARETKLVPRYVEEWLKGMTCAKYLEYDPAAQTYRLSDEHAYLLASDDSDMGLCFLFEGSSGCSLYDERRDGYREKCQTNRTRYAALFLC